MDASIARYTTASMVASTLPTTVAPGDMRTVRPSVASRGSLWITVAKPRDAISSSIASHALDARWNPPSASVVAALRKPTVPAISQRRGRRARSRLVLRMTTVASATGAPLGSRTRPRTGVAVGSDASITFGSSGRARHRGATDQRLDVAVGRDEQIVRAAWRHESRGSVDDERPRVDPRHEVDPVRLVIARASGPQSADRERLAGVAAADRHSRVAARPAAARLQGQHDRALFGRDADLASLEASFDEPEPGGAVERDLRGPCDRHPLAPPPAAEVDLHGGRFADEAAEALVDADRELDRPATRHHHVEPRYASAELDEARGHAVGGDRDARRLDGAADPRAAVRAGHRDRGVRFEAGRDPYRSVRVKARREHRAGIRHVDSRAGHGCAAGSTDRQLDRAERGLVDEDLAEVDRAVFEPGRDRFEHQADTASAKMQSSAGREGESLSAVAAGDRLDEAGGLPVVTKLDDRARERVAVAADELDSPREAKLFPGGGQQDREGGRREHRALAQRLGPVGALAVEQRQQLEERRLSELVGVRPAE